MHARPPEVVRGPRPDEDTTAGSRSTPEERREDTGCRIEAGGGGVVQPRTEIPSMGAFAYFKDTEGNVVGSWETF